ncbi:MAG: hypothetical protein NC338_01235 [Firmicutes bacterium]|nr:hypothetical protein [Bacillota bacterium]
MRKNLTFFLMAMLLPFFASAANMAVHKERASSYGSYNVTENRLAIPCEAFGFSSPMDGSESYTIGTWVKPSNVYSSTKGVLVALSPQVHMNNNGNWVIMSDTSGALSVNGHGGDNDHGLGTVGALNNLTFSKGVTLNEWNFVAVTVDNTNLKFAVYVNGELSGESTMTSAMYFPANLQNGGDGPAYFNVGGQGMNADIDEVHAFNRALSADEVAALYTKGVNGIDGLTGYFTFDEVSAKGAGYFDNLAPNAATESEATFNKWAGIYMWGGWINGSQTPIEATLVEGREIAEPAPSTYTFLVPATDAFAQDGVASVYFHGVGEYTPWAAGTTKELEEGTTVKFSADHATGYIIAGVTVDGVAVDLSETSTGVNGEFQIVSNLTADSFVFTCTQPAPEPVPAEDLTLTFNRTGTDAASVAVNVAGVEGVTATMVSTSQALKGTANAVTSEILCPDKNGNDAARPTMTMLFCINGLPAGYSFDGVGLDIHALNGGGGYQDGGVANGDHMDRQWNVTVETGESASDLLTLQTLTNIDINKVGVTDGKVHKVWDFEATQPVAASNPLFVKIAIQGGTNNSGCFFGLSSIVIKACEATEPEPPVPSTYTFTVPAADAYAEQGIETAFFHVQGDYLPWKAGDVKELEPGTVIKTTIHVADGYTVNSMTVAGQEVTLTPASIDFNGQFEINSNITPEDIVFDTEKNLTKYNFTVPDAEDFPGSNITDLYFTDASHQASYQIGETYEVEEGTEIVVTGYYEGELFKSVTVNGVTCSVTDMDGAFSFHFVVNADVDKNSFVFTMPEPEATLALNGEGQYMRIPHSEEFDIAAGGTQTVTIRAKVTSAANGGIISNRFRSTSSPDDCAGYDIYASFKDNAHVIGWNTNVNAGSWKNVLTGNSATAAQAGEWHSYTWVFNGTDGIITIYIDGVQAAASAYANMRTIMYNPVDPKGDILVGARYNTDAVPNVVNLEQLTEGEFDDLYIYAEALTAEEVAALNNGVAAGKTMLAGYNFTDVQNNVVKDISGNGHDAELVGFTAPVAKVTMTIEQPEHATVTVKAGEETLENEASVEAGTELTVAVAAEAGYTVANITVDGQPIEGNTFTAPEADFTVSATVAEIEYCGYNGYTTQSGRILNSINVNGTDISAPARISAWSWKRDIYVDHSADAIIVAQAGSTLTITSSGNGNWMHTFVYGDFDQNGWNVDPESKSINGDLLWFNVIEAPFESDQYFTMDGKPVNTEAEEHNKNVDGMNIQIQLPADLKPGDYRMRYKLDWGSNDPCGHPNGSKNSMTDNGGAIIDFTLRVAEAQSTTVTVAVAEGQSEMGTVSIEGVEGNSVATTGEVTIKAAANTNNGAKFMNWTVNGEVVSTEADYTFTPTEDATYVANFGWTINYQASTDNGSIEVLNGDAVVASGDAVAPGTVVTINVTPAEGKHLESLTANGRTLTVTDGTATYTVNGYTQISATFAAPLHFVKTVTGNGDVELWTSYDRSTWAPAGEMVEDGAEVNKNGLYYLYVMPGQVQGDRYESIVAFELDLGHQTITKDQLDILGYKCKYNDKHILYMMQVGNTDVIVNCTFSNDVAGIADILFDGIEGETEYYNLNGVRVDAENVQTGFYIIRRGNVSKKVYIQK